MELAHPANTDFLPLISNYSQARVTNKKLGKGTGDPLGTTSCESTIILNVNVLNVMFRTKQRKVRGGVAVLQDWVGGQGSLVWPYEHTLEAGREGIVQKCGGKAYRQELA
jgi:hypothetical protein